MIVVVVHAEHVRYAATPIRPAGAGIQPLQAVASSQRWKRIDECCGAARPVHSEVDVILCALAPPGTAAPKPTEGPEARATARAEVVNQTKVDGIAAAAIRGHVVKILRRGIQVGQRNIREQRFRRRADKRRVDDIEPPIALKLLSRRGIEDLRRTAISISCSRKIAGPFSERWHGGKRVVRRAAAISVPAGEEKPLVAAIENLRNVQRTTEECAKTRQVVAGLWGIQPFQRIRLRVEGGGIIRRVKHPVRLIDVEIAWYARNHDGPTARTTGTTASAWPSALQTTAFALRAVAKLLNALLNVVLAAAAKILRAPLRSSDTHGLRRSVGTGAIEGQRGNVTAISILAAAENAAASAARQSRKSAVQRQALKSAARGDQRGQVPKALILLPRCENHFRIEFSRGSFRLQHDFLRLRREAHEFNAHHVAAARQAGKRVGSIGTCGHRKFLAGEEIGRGDRYARQRSFPGAHNSANFKRGGSRRRRSRRGFSRRLRRASVLGRHRILRAQQISRTNTKKKKQERGQPLQWGGSTGFCEAPPGAEFAGAPARIPPISCIRFHCSGPITITNLGTKTLSVNAPRAKR